MLKETASPLNGFFNFDFLGERGFKGNIYIDAYFLSIN